jgi:L-fuconolactonase
MLLVDAQVHVGLTKYRRLESYLPELEAAGVEKAILVQYAGNTDNSYLLECVRSQPGRFAGIAAVDHDDARGPSQIARLAELGVCSSVRIPAGARTPGPDPLAVWRAVNDAGLVATVQGPFTDIADPWFAEVVTALPELPIMLEHIGCFRYGVDSGFSTLLALGKRPNVYTMWSCFYRFSQEVYPHKDAWPHLAEALEAFGPQRILWSADINRGDQGLGETQDDYRRALDLILDRVAELDEGDRRDILGLNAARVYGLSGKSDNRLGGKAV